MVVSTHTTALRMACGGVQTGDIYVLDVVCVVVLKETVPQHSSVVAIGRRARAACCFLTVEEDDACIMRAMDVSRNL